MKRREWAKVIGNGVWHWQAGAGDAKGNLRGGLAQTFKLMRWEVFVSDNIGQFTTGVFGGVGGGRGELGVGRAGPAAGQLGGGD